MVDNSFAESVALGRRLSQMSIENNSDNNQPVPNITDRKTAIVLSEDIKCDCGRTKVRAHCPVCGKIKLYGRADTVMAVMPNGDVVKDCKTYRCFGCAEIFNDVDWYFNCHAPKKIDWEVTKKLIKEKTRKEAEQRWMHRIEVGERFNYNDRAKCRAEAGFDPEEQRSLMKSADAIYAKMTPEQKAKVDRRRAILRGEIEEEPEISTPETPEIKLGLAPIPVLTEKKLTPLQKHIENCNYCNSHDDNCEVAKNLELAEKLEDQP